MGGGAMAGGAMGGDAMGGPPPAAAPDAPLGFFITSVGLGDGANLGGLAGADAHCQALAVTVGAGERDWRAYLSTQASDGVAAVNARDRIGAGPWVNAKGLRIASDVENLHYDNSAINREHAVNEHGDLVMSRSLGDPKGQHDMLTGSTMAGLAYPSGSDMTCRNWTSNDEGSAMMGHHDRHGFATLGSSWNSVHGSRGCSPENLAATGGEGLFYCFAAD